MDRGTCDGCNCPLTVCKGHSVDVEIKKGHLKRVWRVLCHGCFKTRPKQKTERHQRHAG